MVASKQLRLALETEEERRARLENDAVTKRLKLVMGDGQRKKSKTGEDGSYHRAHVSPDCGCGFVPQTHSEKLATMLIIQT